MSQLSEGVWDWKWRCGTVPLLLWGPFLLTRPLSRECVSVWVCVCVCAVKIHRLTTSNCSHHTHISTISANSSQQTTRHPLLNSNSTSSSSHRCSVWNKNCSKITHTHTPMHTPRKVEQLLLYFCHIQSHQSEAGTMMSLMTASTG